MTRQQKKVWNPALVALKPSHLSWFVWVVLSPFVYMELSDGNFGFFLGLAVGLSFIQAGFSWGQYREHWWRFFLENRTVIFKSPNDNNPTNKKALIYLLSVLAKRAFTPVAILSALVISIGYDRYIGVEFNWVLQLLVVCSLGVISSYILTRKIQSWGEETARRLTDFSYVFESEPEKDLQS